MAVPVAAGGISRLSKGGGDLSSVFDEDLDTSRGLNPETLTTNIEDSLHDIGDQLTNRVNFRVGYGAGALSRPSAVSINRYAPVGSTIAGDSQVQGLSSNLGYGYGGYNNGSIQGRVSVMSKASNRSSLVSGMSLQSSKPVTGKLGNPSYFSTTKYRLLQDGRLPNQTDQKLAGITPYSEYFGRMWALNLDLEKQHKLQSKSYFSQLCNISKL